MNQKFKIGDRVLFTPQYPSNYAAKAGAVAEVVGLGLYLEVKWISGHVDQGNGGYHYEDFQLMDGEFCKTCWQKLPIKPIRIGSDDVIIGKKSIQVGCTKVDRSTIDEIIKRMDSHE